MSFSLRRLTQPEAPSPRCVASVGAGVVCGKDSVPGESLCAFHRTLFGPWFKAATKRAA